MPEFDGFANHYKELLDDSLGRFGGDSAYFTQYKASYVRRIVGGDFSGKVLDYGCGIGMLSQAIHALLPNTLVTGFDVSSECIVVAGKNPSPIRYTCKIEDLGDDFQLVIVSNVFHHIPPGHRARTMAEISSRMESGGRLIVFEHNPLNPMTRLVVHRCPFDEDAILLRPSELSSYFNASGLNRLRRDYIVFFPKMLASLRIIEPWLRLLPIGAQYAMVGGKG